MSVSAIRCAGVALVGVAWLAAVPSTEPAIRARAPVQRLSPSVPAISVSAPFAARRVGLVSPHRARFAFPIEGGHRIGMEAAQRFGGARGHLGQDVFASCGTRVVAARGGVVRRATYEAAAGNYLVVDGRDGRSYVYMHLRKASVLPEGARVTSAQRLGAVGRTGDADGCHLHFEIWTAPGWYSGGKAIDPYKALRSAG